MKKIGLLIICLMLILMTGCWDYKEIEKIEIVNGAGVDFDEKTKTVKVSVEAAKIEDSGKEPKVSYKIILGEGKGFIEAIRNAIMRTHNKLFWSHTDIYILSKNLINNRQYMLGALDFIRRDQETRDDAYIAMTIEDKASDVMNVKFEDGEGVADKLKNTLENVEYISKYRSKKMYEFIDDLETKGINPVLPVIKIVKAEKSKDEDKESDNQGQTLKIEGTAILGHDGVEGYLDGDQTFFYLMIIDKLKGGILFLDKNCTKEDSNLSLEIYSSKTDVKPIIENGKIIFNIDVKMDASISEINGSIDYNTKEKLKEITKKGEEHINHSVKDVIGYVQQEYGTDIFYFAKHMKIKYPDVWKKIENDWKKYYSKVIVNVKSQLKIRGSALNYKPISEGE